MLNKKLKTLNELKVIVKELKSQSKKIVFTNGCFDILHIGHVRCLAEAKTFGDVLIVGLNSDSSVGKLKGFGRPIIGQLERAEMLAAIEVVDYIVFFDELEPTPLIEQLKPDVLVKGGDYEQDQVKGGELVRSWGGEVKIAKFIEGRSSTLLIEALGYDTLVLELEALLFLSKRPVKLKDLANMLKSSESTVADAIERLNRRYLHSSIEVQRTDMGYCLALKPKYVQLLEKISKGEPFRGNLF